MPELPEVETTRRGIETHLLGRRVIGLVIRQRQLRWPVPHALDRSLPGQIIRGVHRRGKYLLLATDVGTAILACAPGTRCGTCRHEGGAQART